jgi:hypothetical protein
MLEDLVQQLNQKKLCGGTFREAAKALRRELISHNRYQEQIAKAKSELRRALRAGQLTAWGKRTQDAQHEAIPAGLFLDDLVSVTEWDTVEGDPERPSKYRGPTFREVRFYSEGVLNVWPEPTTLKAGPQSITKEQALVGYLTDLMRRKPDTPMSKAATKEAATDAKLTFSERGFSRAWSLAVYHSGVTHWSKPGPKPKS